MKDLQLVMESDEDAQIYASIYIEEDDNGSLAILLDENDGGWDYPEGISYEPSKCTIATMDTDEVYIMASYLNIPKQGVMAHLLKEFGDHSYISSPSYVKASFKEILEYILDCGAKYTLQSKVNYE